MQTIPETEARELLYSPRAVTTAKLGRVLAGKYRVESIAGAGTYGVVYVARRLDDGRELAIKTLRRDLTRSEGTTRP